MKSGLALGKRAKAPPIHTGGTLSVASWPSMRHAIFFSPDSLLSILPLYCASRYGIILRRSIDVDCLRNFSMIYALPTSFTVK